VGVDRHPPCVRVHVDEVAGDALAVNLHGPLCEHGGDLSEVPLEHALALVHHEAEPEEGDQDDQDRVPHCQQDRQPRPWV
jgi:hypothetical protein